jgi:hypothetical protein
MAYFDPEALIHPLLRGGLLHRIAGDSGRVPSGRAGRARLLTIAAPGAPRRRRGSETCPLLLVGSGARVIRAQVDPDNGPSRSLLERHDFELFLALKPDALFRRPKNLKVPALP